MSKKELSYEDAIDRLKTILEKLENDDSSLEESMKSFKEGIKLYNYCNSLINKAEGEITLILDKELDNIEEVKFPMEG